MFSVAERTSLAGRLEEAQASLNDGQGVEAVRVIAHLVNIGDIEDAKQMVLLDWDRFESLPVVGELLAKELVPDEINQFTKFRIRLAKE